VVTQARFITGMPSQIYLRGSRIDPKFTTIQIHVKDPLLDHNGDLKF